ncbi:hypothetical protein MKW92_001258 [Papaver armeniacum]|nr:hypothetical protein MKW92_001258 [Papaver armeniacum]
MEISSMSLQSFLILSLLACCSNGAISVTTSSSTDDDFIQCLSINHNPNIPTIPIYTQINSSYPSLLRSSARNLRILSSTTKPKFIITPTHESHFQKTVICCKKNDLDLKVRSGGHDAEGLSYVSDAISFVLLDLINFRDVTVDVDSNTAWIQAGASLGEVYYRVAEKSKIHGFPAGFCPTVGVGGHISGGGTGALVRKYGLAADQVIDACIVNAEGEILDRETMGNDLFWAIRGGGAASFGVVLSWKVRLVTVLAMVIVATVRKTMEQGAADIVHKWQFIADKIDENVFIGLTLSVVSRDHKLVNKEKTVLAEFTILFVGEGGVEKLLQLVEDRFSELGLTSKDCIEMSWVESDLYFSHQHGKPLESLLVRDNPNKNYFFKSKSDYVKTPVSKMALAGLWRMLLKQENVMPMLIWTPYGGKMNEISEFEIPFPHRQGNIYNIEYSVSWSEENESEMNLEWMKKLYEYMTPYVSKNPRTAYLNSRDLDLGQQYYEDNQDISNHLNAEVWGRKYFKDNFERLVKVKSEVDPQNFFKNRQSIPPITLGFRKEIVQIEKEIFFQKL